MSTPTPLPPEGWYPDPDPAGTGRLRWWNGTTWTQHTQPAAPVPPPPEPAAAPQPPQADEPAAQGSTPGYQGAYPGGPQAYRPATAPIGVWRSPVDDRPNVLGMGTAIRTVFAKYAQFDGRAGRPEFWFWALFNGIVVAGGYLIIGILTATARESFVFGPLAAFAGLLIAAVWLWELAVVVPNLAVIVRRLRDGGLHWAFVFLGLVPVAGWIAVLVLCAQPSRHP